MKLANSPLQFIHPTGWPIGFYIKRDDLLHPIVSGNKWRKLKHTIALMQNKNYKELCTFGGAYSNHLVAVAAAAAEYKLKANIFVRGNEVMDSHYLKIANLYGANLIAVTRDDYKNKNALFQTNFDSNLVFYIPEGGQNETALLGLQEIETEIDLPNFQWVHASATGTTACGLAKSNQIVHAIAVLKNQEEQISYFNLHKVANNIQLHTQFTHGGYAKTSPELMQFCKNFITDTAILIDPVYTGKALFALHNLITNSKINTQIPIVFLHTGGNLGLFSKTYLNSF